MSLIVILIPLCIIMISLMLFVVKKLIKASSLKKFVLIYWTILATAEICMLVYIALYGSVQFIPPSIIINYIYGTPFFIYFVLQCIVSKKHGNKTIKFIIYGALLNYIILPIGLIWIN